MPGAGLITDTGTVALLKARYPHTIKNAITRPAATFANNESKSFMCFPFVYLCGHVSILVDFYSNVYQNRRMNIEKFIKQENLGSQAGLARLCGIGRKAAWARINRGFTEISHENGLIVWLNPKTNRKIRDEAVKDATI